MKGTPRALWGALTPGRRALLTIALLFHLSLLISLSAGWYQPFTFDSVATHGRRGWDFYALYQAGHNALTGVSIYESDNDKIDVVAPVYTPYRYLPFGAWTLGVALNALSPEQAFGLWELAIEGTLLACVVTTWRLVREPNRGALLSSMWLLYTPLYLEFYLGQFSLVQAAFVWAMLLACRSGWTRRADVWWALSLLWKQNTALLAPVYLRHKRFQSLAWVGLVVLAASLPYWLAMPGAWADFAQNLTAVPGHQLGNLGVRQWLYSLASWLAPYLSPSEHIWLGRIWVLAVIIVSALVTLRAPHDNAPALICLWLTTYFLIYHDVWEHHYVLAVPVCVWLVYQHSSRWVLACWALLAIWTPYVFIDPTGQAAVDAAMRWTPLSPPWLDVIYHSTKALPIVALWGWQVWQLGQQRQPCSPDCATT